MMNKAVPTSVMTTDNNGPRSMFRCLLTTSLVIAFSYLAVNTAFAEENASNPLAAVNNTDIRAQYFDLGDADRYDFYPDGSYMLTPKLKLKYELHYWSTDVTGSDEQDFESFTIKPIYFPAKGHWGEWNYKLAAGGDWIVSFDNEDKGIGDGSDQIALLVGMAFSKGKTVLVPLAQHFYAYDGPDVSTSSVRLIAIQALPEQYWAKLDFKIPIEWENDNAIPATVETQLGKNFTPGFGLYLDLNFGLGSDRPYNWGTGVGLRFKY